MTLQQAIDQYVMQRSILNPSTGRRIYVGPFKETEHYREVTDRIMREDVYKKSEQDYLIKGYSRNEFKSKEQLEQWAREHIPYVEYEQAKRNILQHGQTAVARVVTQEDTGFQVIELEPVPGRWWSFETQAQRDEWAKINFKFHISLTHKHRSWADPQVFERIKRRYDGRTITIKISEIKPSGNLMLDLTDGIGADPDVQELYSTGTYAGKWEQGYGPHISM